MCTVTFIPGRDKIYLTSNRDEKSWRSPALLPKAYSFSTGNMVFPRDGDAGGTWIAVHENGNAIVFLNGGWVCHTPQPPYRKSRGLILLDLLNSTTPYETFLVLSLNNIEPFTAVLWDDSRLFECRWDGEQKYYSRLNATVPHIWSSVTLYNTAVISKRRAWFESWLQQHTTPQQEQILAFHQFTGDGDPHNDLMMNRDGKVFTVSVTSLAITPRAVSMQYLDLKNKQVHTQELIFEKTMVGR